MENLNALIGHNIRAFRKKRGLTLVDFADNLCKSKATVSKYERGEITLDICTLYEIASALHIQVGQLLPATTVVDHPDTSHNTNPAFFSGFKQFYSYLYDGRSNQVIRCVFDVVPSTTPGHSQVFMYMNFNNYNNYQDCENTYLGTIEHYDALTRISLVNQDTQMEKVTISILASFLDANTKWGLFTGISSRPMMPISVKMLFSKKILQEDAALIERLKINREDIRLLRLYNMFSAT